jgi:TP901 family phage tail tape measure protein
MAQIRIRIGASIDASVERSFSTIEARARKAEAAIRAAAERGQKAQVKAGDKAADAAAGQYQRTTNAAEKAANDQAKIAERAARIEIRSAERAAAERSKIAARLARDQERAEVRATRAAEKAAHQQQIAADRFARRTSHRATQFLMPNAPIGSMAARGLGQVARGLGVDANVSSLFSRVKDQGVLATDLSNQGYLPNAPEGNANRTRVDPNALIAQARGVTSKYGISAEDALGGLGEYAKISGDLDAARRALEPLAKLSAATGTNLADMAAAAGNVDMQLGDIPDKATIVERVMRMVAGQGKLGGVEIRDMATQMARVAASAGKFEGDRADNIIKMSALAQISRGTGGAPSAAEAARATVGFTNTLKKGARLKEFDAAGIDVYNDQNQMRDPFKIIEDSLTKTQGDPRKMNKLFMDVVGERAISGLTSTFNTAGGGDAGIAAVREQLDKFVKDAEIRQEELDESARRAAETTAAKAEKFNNQLVNITDKVSTTLIPALETHADSILKFAEVIGSVATWAVENPKTAIAAAISASIARAGIESVFRSGIESMISAGNGGKGVAGYNRSAGFGGGVGMVGNIGAALTIGTLAVTTLQVGMAIIDSWMAKKEEAQKKRTEESQEVSNLTGKIRNAKDLPSAQALAEEQVTKAKAAVEKTKAELESGPASASPMNAQDAQGAALGKMIMNLLGVGDAKDAKDMGNKMLLEAQQRELASSNRILSEIRDAIQNQGPALPGVDTQAGD